MPTSRMHGGFRTHVLVGPVIGSVATGDIGIYDDS